MEINFTILDKIKSHNEGKLTKQESKKLEGLIHSNSIYQYHNQLYQSMNRGIRNATFEKQLQWIHQQKSILPNSKEVSLLSQLKKQEKQSAKKKRIILMSLLVGIIFLIGWAIFSFESNEKIEDLNRLKVPIAEDEKSSDNTELFGGTGVGEEWSIPVFVKPQMDENYQEIFDSKSIFVYFSEGTLSYLFRDQTLNIFISNNKTIDQQQIYWLVVESQNYLQIEGIVYELNLNQIVRAPLQSTNDEVEIIKIDK